MKIEQTKLNAMRDTLATVIPEAAGMYVRNVADFDGLPVPKCIYGVAFDCPFELRPMIDRLGEDYRGPGSIIGIDGYTIAELAPLDQFDRFVMAVLVHEVCHLSHTPPPLECPSTPRIVATQTAWLKRSIDLPEEQPYADPAHDWRFVRRCGHAIYRCLSSGIDVPWREVLGYQYPTAVIETYIMLLLGECRELATAPFAVIEAREPPAAFLETWQDYQRDYIERQKYWERNKCQTTDNN